ncbi:MAG TPA: MBL fold metallo-hydrolase [Blastocatellia bacterium]|nr:MBL fold metallo-hydrolase [Blastocatellia bacterium]
MRKLCLLSALVLALSAAGVSPGGDSAPARQTLDIYYVDVEGGAATLIVTPAGESILVDAGWPGFEGRDAKRIQQAMRQAGITEIDHLIMTHYHTDHYGGIPELARLVKINHFYDHGPMTSLAEDKDFATRYSAYRAAAGDKTITLRPGDTIKLREAKGTPLVRLRCLAANGEVPAGKGPPNSQCVAARPMPEDKSDNARSVVLLLRFGDFEFLDCGDLTWNIEEKLVCPANQIGEVDLYQVTHHGLNTSNNLVLLRSVRPTVAIMNNGPRKGGHPDTVKALRELSSLKDLYQLHRNVTTTEEQNTTAEFIANLDEQPDEAHLITVSVDDAKRTFTVTNARTQKSKSYRIR